jgi:hypothetical protein
MYQDVGSGTLSRTGSLTGLTSSGSPFIYCVFTLLGIICDGSLTEWTGLGSRIPRSLGDEVCGQSELSLLILLLVIGLEKGQVEMLWGT